MHHHNHHINIRAVYRYTIYIGQNIDHYYVKKINARSYLPLKLNKRLTYPNNDSFSAYFRFLT